MSIARCLKCGHEAHRGEFNKTRIDGEVFDTCPVFKCGSLDVDVLSATGLEVEARIAAVAAGEVLA